METVFEEYQNWEKENGGSCKFEKQYESAKATLVGIFFSIRPETLQEVFVDFFRASFTAKSIFVK